jgi:hypothetical protein
MRLLKGSLLFAAYIVLPIAIAYAQPFRPPEPPKPPRPPLPCSACGLNAPEFDLSEIISGVALSAGAAFLLLDRFRRKR